MDVDSQGRELDETMGKKDAKDLYWQEEWCFEEVQKFKYLGSTITENNETSEEIKSRTVAENRNYYALKNTFQPRNV